MGCAQSGPPHMQPAVQSGYSADSSEASTMTAAAVRPRRGYVGIDEVGQTNAPTLGPNFVKALCKAQRTDVAGPLLLAGLLRLGFGKIAADLEPAVQATARNAPVETKEKLWCGLAAAYTKEDSGDVAPDGQAKCLYRELNNAIRWDSACLMDWAPFYGLLLNAADQHELVHSRIISAPESVRPRREQTVYRGFAVDPSILTNYYIGKRFFWQAFVSTSTDLEASRDFAMRNVSADQISLLFDIKLPEYKDEGRLRFYVYDLASVSDFPEEAEMLLMPFTRFAVISEPTVDDLGVTHVGLQAIDTPFPLDVSPPVVVVWVDPSGFGAGDNFVIAKMAFMDNMPRFRSTEHGEIMQYSWGSALIVHEITYNIAGMGLFTHASVALQWMQEQVRKNSAVIFRVVVSGSASKDLLDAYFAESTPNPCEVLVFCANQAKWAQYWSKCKHINVTNEARDVENFLKNFDYDQTIDSLRPATLPGNGTQVWYPWRVVDGGVIYGGAGYHSDFVEEGWSSQGGAYPEVPMRPFE